MPQLDSNTFIYQYIGIISVFIIIYITLSYIVLPIALRLISFRAKFLDSHQALNDSLTSVSPFYKSSLVLSSSLINRFYNQLGSLVTRSSKLTNLVLSIIVLTTTLNNKKLISATSAASGLFFLASDFYLMLVLVYYELVNNNVH